MGYHIRSHKSAYDPIKIENRSRKQGHWLDKIEIRKILIGFLFRPLYKWLQRLLHYRSRKNKRKELSNQTGWVELSNLMAVLVAFQLRLRQSSFHLILSDRVVGGTGILLSILSF